MTKHKKYAEYNFGAPLNTIVSQPAFTCSKLTIETLELGVKYVQWRCSGIFIVNFEHISYLVLVFLLLTLNMLLPAGASCFCNKAMCFKMLIHLYDE